MMKTLPFHASALVAASGVAGLLQSAWLVFRYQELLTSTPMLARGVAVGFLLGTFAAAALMPLALILRLAHTERKTDPPAATAVGGLAVAAVLTWATVAPTFLADLGEVAGKVVLVLGALGLGGLVLRRMRIRRWIPVPIAVVTIVAAPLAVVFGPPPAPPVVAVPTDAAPGPDVLVITIDTLRADRLGPWTRGVSLTPEIDQLASEGVAYTRALAPAPWTLPSMATLMTGRTALEHGAGRPLVATALNRRTPLGSDLPTLAERFAEHGYRTGAIVSNVFLSPDFGLNRGFQTYANPLFERAFAAVLKENALTRIIALSVPPETFGDPRATGMVASALDWWGDPASAAPRFLWLHLIDPHSPFRRNPDHLELQSLLDEWHTEAEVQPDGTLVGEQFGEVMALRSGSLWIQPADRERMVEYYDGAVRYTDTALGPLFEAMRASDRDVLVVLTADHGEEFWDHGGFEHGHDYYSEVTRVPLVFCGAGVAGGRTVTEPVGLVDVPGTVLAMAGFEADAAQLGGEVLTGVAGPTEQDLPPRFCENNLYNLPAVLVEDGPWRFIRRANGTRELYDVVADPDERHDLSWDQPEVVDRLDALLEPRMAAFDGTISPDASLDGPSVETTEALKMLGYVE
jgi:arylsulfatase A-like enzyme